MARPVSRTITAALFICALASPGRAAGLCGLPGQRGPAPAPQRKGDQRSDHQGPKKWWIEADLRAELGITDQQSAAIEKVWQASLPKRAETRERLDQLDAVLSKMILEAADEGAVSAQIDRVEAARSEASKARMLMLYRMNKVLTQEQRAKLDAKVKAMRDQRDGGRRNPSPSL